MKQQKGRHNDGNHDNNHLPRLDQLWQGVDYIMEEAQRQGVGDKVLERAAGHACGAYEVPSVDVEARAVYTNNPPCGAMRGFGVNQVTFAVDGSDQLIVAAPAYFTFASSDATVATADASGVITVVGPGTTTITGLLGATAASGEVTLTAVAPPATAAPTPISTASSRGPGRSRHARHARVRLRGRPGWHRGRRSWKLPRHHGTIT